MCYGQGGREPTVTDATLVLGRVPPHLLGGEIRSRWLWLDRGSRTWPRRSASTRTERRGVLEIAAWSQANAVRQVTVKRGLDIRDYVLVAFGGSGPLQAGKLVDILDLQAALVPPDPGNVSAFGLLTVDVKNDYVTTAVQRDDLLDLDVLNASYARLEQQARDALAAEGFTSHAMRVVRSADMRYFGQAWEVRVEVPDGPIDRACADLVVERFHAAHQQTYGYSYVASPDQRIEWVNSRVMGIGPIRRPVIQPRPRVLAGGAERALTGHRPVYFARGQGSGARGRWETPIFARQRLQPGDCIIGRRSSKSLVRRRSSFPAFRPASTTTPTYCYEDRETPPRPPRD